MEAINKSLERSAQRESIARDLVLQMYLGNHDVEVGDDVDYVDGGYWVAVRVFVSADEVEERMPESQHGE